MEQNAQNNLGMGIGNFALQSTIIASIMSKVKTGNAITDIILTGLISSIFTMIFNGIPTVITDAFSYMKNKFYLLFSKVTSSKEVTIKHVQIYNIKSGARFSGNSGQNNNHLVDALETYIQENQIEIRPRLIQCNLSNTLAEHTNDYKYMKTHCFKFSNCDPIIELKNGITLFIENSETQNDKNVITTRLVKLCSKESHEQVVSFLNTVYNNYVEKNYKKYDSSDDKRYFLTLKGEKDDSYSKSLKWKRYELKTKRNFESIFFPEKETVIQLLDDFKNKSGIYAKKCIPYKLSFCLSGVPGTGKTTFLKALSEYTKRHIFNISLPLIETNEQLIDVAHNSDIRVYQASDTYTISIPLNKRIYVFEDVDVLSDIVNRRSDSNTPEFNVKKQGIREVTDICKKCKHFIVDNVDSDSSNDRSDEDSDSDDSRDSDDSDVNNDEIIHKDEICECENPIRRKNPKLKKLDKTQKMKKGKKDSSNVMMYSSSYERYCIQEDKLNLSGLLNMLDGLLELDDVIIVLTTNHPEKLDPALIRHGRITHHLEMTYITAPEIKKMIKYHFPDATENDFDEVLQYKLENLTPAKVENLCIQSKNLDAMKKMLSSE